MGYLTSNQMQTELAARVPGILTGSGSRAETAIDRAVRWINRQGSFTFNMLITAPGSMAFTGDRRVAPSDFDGGKACLLLNPNGTPVRKISPGDGWQAENYNTITDSGFDVYWLGFDQSFSPTAWTFMVRPASIGTVSCTLVYHKITSLFHGSSVSRLPDDFDDLIIDLAEAEERRIYDVGSEWQLLLGRSQEQIIKLLDGYRSDTTETGLSSAAQLLVQEKTQLGRG